jgi:hypothetical protein
MKQSRSFETTGGGAAKFLSLRRCSMRKFTTHDAATRGTREELANFAHGVTIIRVLLQTLNQR